MSKDDTYIIEIFKGTVYRYLDLVEESNLPIIVQAQKFISETEIILEEAAIMHVNHDTKNKIEKALNMAIREFKDLSHKDWEAMLLSIMDLFEYYEYMEQVGLDYK